MEGQAESHSKVFFSRKQLTALIIPLVLEQILGVTVGMADTVMVSRAGEAAVSGVSLVDNINLLLVNLFLSLSTGGAVAAAHALGQKNERKACQAADQLLLAVVSLSLVIMALSLAGNRLILKTIFGGVEPAVMENAVIYFYITALSFPFLAAQNGCSALCRAMGNTRITMLVSLMLNLINISGNAFFLLVLNWDAAGVAAATLIARIIGALVMLLVVRDQKKPLHLTRPFPRKYDWCIIKDIMSVGIPTGLDNAIFQVGKILVQSLVVSFGTAAIAANAVVGMTAGFAYIPGNAVGIAFLTVLGQTVGAEEYELSKSYIRKLMKPAVFSMALLNLGIICIAGWLVGIYHLSPEGSEMAYQVIVYHSIAAILFWPPAFTLPNALRAADDARFTMIVSIASMWIWRVGFSYLLGRYLHMGLLGVWAAMSVDWLFRAACFIWRVASGRWLINHKRLTGAGGENGT